MKTRKSSLSFSLYLKRLVGHYTLSRLLGLGWWDIIISTDDYSGFSVANWGTYDRGLRVDTGMLLFFTDNRRLLGILLLLCLWLWKMPSSLRFIAGMTSVGGGSVAVSRHGNNGPVVAWMLSRHVAAAKVGRGADGHVTSRLCACAWATGVR